MVYCSKCGTESLDDKDFCIKCGAPLKQVRLRYPEEQARNVDPILLIGIFIIIIGIMFSFGMNFGRTIGSWGESFGETMGNWGNNFGEEMGKLGQSLGEYFSEWGSNLSKTIGSYVLIFIGLLIIVYQYGQRR
jgi:putative Mn2+ efflux pump MntP